ncbi:MAG TPA: hypothetical protein VJH24_02355, partial [Candidatus Bilamarchaeaceae archaeon]|nr:hypothetical protein [Candidatus Bilamarchaeaceae archaeon]
KTTHSLEKTKKSGAVAPVIRPNHQRVVLALAIPWIFIEGKNENIIRSEKQKHGARAYGRKG